MATLPVAKPASPEAVTVEAGALVSAVTTIAADLDLHGILSRTVAAAVELGAARSGRLVLVDGDGQITETALAGEDGPPTAPGTSLEVPIKRLGALLGTLHVAGKRGPVTDADVMLLEVLAAAAGPAIDNARTVIRNERRRRWLEATADLTEALQPPLDPVRAMADIAHSTMEVTGATATAVITPSGTGEPFLAAVAGFTSDDFEPWLHDIETGSIRAAHGEVVNLAVDRFAALVVSMDARLSAPSRLVCLFDPAQCPRDPVERQSLAAFASQAALALDHGRAVVEHEHAAVVVERERIARDLHDAVIQRLFAIGLRLEVVRNASPALATHQPLDGCIREIDAVIRTIRSTIFSLEDRSRESGSAPTVLV